MSASDNGCCSTFPSDFVMLQSTELVILNEYLSTVVQILGYTNLKPEQIRVLPNCFAAGICVSSFSTFTTRSLQCLQTMIIALPGSFNEIWLISSRFRPRTVYTSHAHQRPLFFPCTVCYPMRRHSMSFLDDLALTSGFLPFGEVVSAFWQCH